MYLIKQNKNKKNKKDTLHFVHFYEENIILSHANKRETKNIANTAYIMNIPHRQKNSRISDSRSYNTLAECLKKELEIVWQIC